MGFDPMTMGLMVSAGTGLISSIFGAKSSEKASQQQAAAQMAALAQQKELYNTGASAVSPYANAGMGGVNALTSMIPSLMTPNGPNLPGGTNFQANVPTFAFAPTMETLEKTPGYQFTLGQGLKAVQNSAAARGLGSSGTALRGAADYATSLAGTTFQQQFDNYLKTAQANWANYLGAGQQDWQNAFQSGQTNWSDLFQQRGQGLTSLLGLGQLGSAAAGTMMQGSNTAGSTMGNTLMGLGNAQAAGTMGVSNAITGGVNNTANQYMQYNMLNSILEKMRPNGQTTGQVAWPAAPAAANPITASSFPAPWSFMDTGG